MTPVEPTLLSTVQGVSLSNLLAGTTTPLFSGTLTVSLVSTGTSTPPYAGSSAPPFPPRQRPTSHLLLSLSAPDNLGEPLYELLVSPSSTVLKLPPSRFLLPIEQGVADDDERGFLQITLVEPDDFFESVLLGFTAPVTPPPMEQELEGADPELRSKLFLVDEDQTIVGELATGIEMTEDPALVKTSMEPVVVDFGAQGAVGTSDAPTKVSIRPLSPWEAIPNPTNSHIISVADYVSRGIVVGAELVAQGLEMGAATFVRGTKATKSPLVFSDGTRKNVESGHKLTEGAMVVSGKVIGVVGDVATKVGGVVGKSLGIQSKSNGKTPTGIKGVVHKSLIAFNAVTDSLETGGKTLLQAGTNSSSAVVGHKLGPDAANLTRKVGGSVKHVVLVYVDARGVTRKALLKSVGKAAVHAKMTDGREVILSEDNSKIQLETGSAPAGGSGARTPPTKGVKGKQA